ncbi:DNA repair protein RecN [Apilactobacillus xinyiensis]|uniref:DNA repair protein RecN n=1 Tax=Apilactobacillus xinyiensis TaxID=2841032 RepID=UPI00200F1EA2|nr:DNA repair protein RecN [Apilactobacillus xinyiensis]MCL0318390.1 DNA repair protein RecN [Apilactobacillus xinyiensis]
MLQELSIDNLAIIEHLDVDFASGMTVLTGETGAGKSIIIDAVSLLAGGRGSQTFIRNGAKKLNIQGLFAFDANDLTYKILDDLGINHDDGSVIIQREIYRNGRNVCRVNGILVNTTNLKKIGKKIVDIQGQNEHQELMNSELHVSLLDSFDLTHIKPILDEYTNCYDKYNQISNMVRKKRDNQYEWTQRIDMLKFQTAEIENAHLDDDNEEQSLSIEREHLRNYQKIVDTLTKTFSLISGNDSMSPIDMIGEAKSSIKDIEDIDDSFHGVSDDINNAYYSLQDAVNNISSQLDLQEFDENRLNEIEQRFDLINNLKSKYGNSISEIKTYYQKAKKELDDMLLNQSDNVNLEEKLALITSRLDSIGQKLDIMRIQTAKSLEKSVHEQLSDLYMSKAIFKVHFEALPDNEFRSYGRSKIEFYIRTNPGEQLQPLAKIASGGELSRIMLALKTIFAADQQVTSIIFDEVDTGVSGRVAQAIAEKISQIACHSQVLCITHLPQVASMADHHYFIEKSSTNNSTETSVRKLNNNDRVNELARMLAGTKITELTLNHAKELLNLANQAKHN